MVELNNLIVAQLKERDPMFPDVERGVLVPTVSTHRSRRSKEKMYNPSFVKLLHIHLYSCMIIVWQVIPGSPADRAGFKPGDVVVRFDGKPVETIKEACVVSLPLSFSHTLFFSHSLCLLSVRV